MFGKKEELRVDSEVFVIYDSKSESYGELIQATNGPDIIRRICNIFRAGRDLDNNPHWMNAEDFSLFKVATYDKKTGKLQAVTPPQHVANFHELRSLVLGERKFDRPLSEGGVGVSVVPKVDPGIVAT